MIKDDPAGLHVIFYKRFWSMLGEELIEEVLQAVSSCSIPACWNDTAIFMIPKVNAPEKITQLRPISLCNVVYKFISKMIVTHLKAILVDIISPIQSAFIPGRMTTHNILVAYECFHTIKKRAGKEGLCAIKLDMHKAYDRVEWSFFKKQHCRNSVYMRIG